MDGLSIDRSASYHRLMEKRDARMTVVASAVQSFKLGFCEGSAMWCWPFIALAKLFRIATPLARRGDDEANRRDRPKL